MQETITPKEYLRRTSGRRKRNKYNAKKTPYKGVLYDSKLEAQFADYLEKHLKAGLITKVERQPHYVVLDAGVTDNGTKYSKVIYTPDFLVTYPNGAQEAIEIKGKETKDFLIRKKFFYFSYPWLPLKILTYTKRTGWIELDKLKKIRAERRKLT
ncbi:MAG: DUF1064 domain-containing protein [Sporolactobacillus sp.]